MYTKEQKDCFVKCMRYLKQRRMCDEKAYLEYNMLISPDELQYVVNGLYQFDKAYNNGEIYNINLDAKILQDTYYLGVSMANHLSIIEYECGRCHGVVLGLSLILDNFVWRYANIKNYAYKQMFHCDDVMKNAIAHAGRCYIGELGPVYKHSYIEVQGQELIDKNLIKLKNGQKPLDANKIYVLSSDGNVVMEKTLYENTMQPEIWNSFNSQDVKSVELWQQIDKMKKLPLTNEKFLSNLLNIYKDSFIYPINTKDDFWIYSCFWNDYNVFVQRDNDFFVVNDIIHQECGQVGCRNNDIAKMGIFFDSKMYPITQQQFENGECPTFCCEH